MSPEQIVKDFIGERPQFITAITNCAPDNRADYWRWQGHAEARRHLAERLAAAAVGTPNQEVDQ